jgi:hypothetical protein
MENNQNSPSASWNEIFKEIGIQLRQRSGLLTKRVLFISAPALLFFLIIRIVLRMPNISSWLRSSDISTQIEGVYFGTFIIIILAITTMIAMAISKVEQTIWLDSYFDGKNLLPQESLHIAKKLFFAWSRLQRKLFIRYYIWIVISIIAVFIVGIYVFVISNFGRSLSINAIATGWISYVLVSRLPIVYTGSCSTRSRRSGPPARTRDAIAS